MSTPQHSFHFSFVLHGIDHNAESQTTQAFRVMNLT